MIEHQLMSVILAISKETTYILPLFLSITALQSQKGISVHFTIIQWLRGILCAFLGPLSFY